MTILGFMWPPRSSNSANGTRLLPTSSTRRRVRAPVVGATSKCPWPPANTSHTSWARILRRCPFGTLGTNYGTLKRVFWSYASVHKGCSSIGYMTPIVGGDVVEKRYYPGGCFLAGGIKFNTNLDAPNSGSLMIICVKGSATSTTMLEATTTSSTTLEATTTSTTTLEATTTSTTTTLAEYPTMDGYCTPGKDLLWVDEGSDVGSSSFSIATSPDDGTPGECATFCNEMAGCNAFSKCSYPPRCWLKNQEVADPASEATSFSNGCTFFYKADSCPLPPSQATATTVEVTTTSTSTTTLEAASTTARPAFEVKVTATLNLEVNEPEAFVQDELAKQALMSSLAAALRVDRSSVEVSMKVLVSVPGVRRLQYSTLDGYCTPGEDLLWVDEGSDVGSSPFSIATSPDDGTPGQCASFCNEMAGCNAFAKCHNPTVCWLKNKEVADPASEATRSMNGCTFFYKADSCPLPPSQATTTSTTTTQAQDSTLDGYCTPGEDLLWVDEGSDVGSSPFSIATSPDDGTPGQCASFCNEMAGCNAFAKCHNPTVCWLKNKEVADPASEATRSMNGCTFFYKADSCPLPPSQATTTSSTTLEATTTSTTTLEATTTSTTTTQAQYSTLDGYCTPGEDLLWVDEGSDVGSSPFSIATSPDDGTPGQCASFCNEMAGCNAFAKCHNPTVCWLKNKEVADPASEATRSMNGCTFFYKADSCPLPPSQATTTSSTTLEATATSTTTLEATTTSTTTTQAQYSTLDGYCTPGEDLLWVDEGSDVGSSPFSIATSPDDGTPGQCASFCNEMAGCNAFAKCHNPTVCWLKNKEVADPASEATRSMNGCTFFYKADSCPLPPSQATTTSSTTLEATTTSTTTLEATSTSTTTTQAQYSTLDGYCTPGEDLLWVDEGSDVGSSPFSIATSPDDGTPGQCASFCNEMAGCNAFAKCHNPTVCWLKNKEVADPASEATRSMNGCTFFYKADSCPLPSSQATATSSTTLEATTTSTTTLQATAASTTTLEATTTSTTTTKGPEPVFVYTESNVCPLFSNEVPEQVACVVFAQGNGWQFQDLGFRSNYPGGCSFDSVMVYWNGAHGGARSGTKKVCVQDTALGYTSSQHGSASCPGNTVKVSLGECQAVAALLDKTFVTESKSTMPGGCYDYVFGFIVYNSAESSTATSAARVICKEVGVVQVEVASTQILREDEAASTVEEFNQLVLPVSFEQLTQDMTQALTSTFAAETGGSNPYEVNLVHLVANIESSRWTTTLEGLETTTTLAATTTLEALETTSTGTMTTTTYSVAFSCQRRSVDEVTGGDYSDCDRGILGGQTCQVTCRQDQGFVENSATFYCPYLQASAARPEGVPQLEFEAPLVCEKGTCTAASLPPNSVSDCEGVTSGRGCTGSCGLGYSGDSRWYLCHSGVTFLHFCGVIKLNKDWEFIMFNTIPTMN